MRRLNGYQQERMISSSLGTNEFLGKLSRIVGVGGLAPYTGQHSSSLHARETRDRNWSNKLHVLPPPSPLFHPDIRLKQTLPTLTTTINHS